MPNIEERDTAAAIPGENKYEDENENKDQDEIK
jgi:hypothetical protein